MTGIDVSSDCDANTRAGCRDRALMEKALLCFVLLTPAARRTTNPSGASEWWAAKFPPSTTRGQVARAIVYRKVHATSRPRAGIAPIAGSSNLQRASLRRNVTHPNVFAGDTCSVLERFDATTYAVSRCRTCRQAGRPGARRQAPRSRA
jgi:hypothetical protein